MTARTQPYTITGLSRVPCARCGQPSAHQWSLHPCATGKRRWHGLCTEHDVELNRQMLAYFNVPGAAEIADEYERKVA